MAVITVRFRCGHVVGVTGGEERLICTCGETTIDAVDIPLPQFRGHVRGPHAEYKDLPAEAVSFGAPKNG